jgi:hypothetical protein
MSEPMNDKQLLAVVDTSTLSNEQLLRRSALVTMRKAEREMALAEYQNQKFEDDQETKRIMHEAKIENIKAIQDKEIRERSMCKHKTGGMDKPGFFNGDGERYGSSTALLKLPTGEVYALCFRCQKEWHAPSKRAVINGQISAATYFKLLKEYNEVLEWPRKSFAPWQGEIAAASQFYIPKLKMQEEKDNREFVVYCSKLPAQVLNLAQNGIESVQELEAV